MDKIICVGKNYADHVQEMGDTPLQEPVLFLKPPSVLKQAQANGLLNLSLPEGVGEVHYETEIVLKLQTGGYQLNTEQAAIILTQAEVSLGLDMTLRTRQAQLKKSGQPWTTAKVFPDAAVTGPYYPAQEFPHWLETEFTFTLAEVVRQRGCGKNMLWSPLQLLVYISQFFPLCAGDLIFTGTPSGVGAIKKGDSAQLNWGPCRYTVVWN